jgi:hypothetical protein
MRTFDRLWLLGLGLLVALLSTPSSAGQLHSHSGYESCEVLVSFERCTCETPSPAGGLAFDLLLLAVVVVVVLLLLLLSSA